MNEKSWIYTGLLIASLLVVIFLASRGVVQGLVSEGDITLSLDRQEYQGDEIIRFQASLGFADKESAIIETVTLEIRGRNNLNVRLPLEAGEHALTQEHGVDEFNPMTATVRFMNIDEIGTPGATATPIIFKGIGQNARIEIDIDWDPDQDSLLVTGDYTANLTVQVEGLPEELESGPASFSIVPVIIEVIAPQEVTPNEEFETIIRADAIRGLKEISLSVLYENTITLLESQQNDELAECYFGEEANTPGILEVVIDCQAEQTGNPLQLTTLTFRANPTIENTQAPLDVIVLNLNSFGTSFPTIPSETRGALISIALECGDLNGDGHLTVEDATTILQFFTQFTNATETQEIVGDLNRDGKLSIIDAIEVLRQVAGESVDSDTCGP